MKKVLLVCTVPALDVYSMGILAASMQSGDFECFACVFLAGEDMRSEDEHIKRFGISERHRSHVHFYKLHKNKVIRILSGSEYLSFVKHTAALNQIDIVHFITQDVMLYGHLKRFKGYKLYYTVHDLMPHPVKLNALERFKHYYFRIRKDELLVETIPNLVTNSDHQYRALVQRYPDKHIYHHPMPGVVPAIKIGRASIPELDGIDKYVLFFGQIEQYKGVEELYNTFFRSDLLSGYKLVIAGAGNIYFPTREAENIVFLNRFIQDEEVGDLFKKSLLLILPYQSATQSSLSAIAYHYQVPVVAADIEGLRDTVWHEKTGLLYDPAVSGSMEAAIIRMLSDTALQTKVFEFTTQTAVYDEKILRDAIWMIYA